MESCKNHINYQKMTFTRHYLNLFAYLKGPKFWTSLDFGQVICVQFSNAEKRPKSEIANLDRFFNALYLCQNLRTLKTRIWTSPDFGRPL